MKYRVEFVLEEVTSEWTEEEVRGSLFRNGFGDPTTNDVIEQ